MTQTTTIALTLLILAVLVLASMAFNRYVDRHPLTRRADGETALWVVIGNAYTAVGATALLALWAPLFGADWRVGFLALLCMICAFVAAGIPMFFGDLRRTQAWRETNEHLTRAERANGVRK